MSTLSITYRDQFTRQTERLVRALMEHTGVSASAVLVPTGGNSAYLKQVRDGGKHGVSVGKHDTFLENISALWPDDLAWPEDIPRPPREKAGFDQLPQEARDAFAARIQRQQTIGAAKHEKANG